MGKIANAVRTVYQTSSSLVKIRVIIMVEMLTGPCKPGPLQFDRPFFLGEKLESELDNVSSDFRTDKPYQYRARMRYGSPFR